MYDIYSGQGHSAHYHSFFLWHSGSTQCRTLVRSSITYGHNIHTSYPQGHLLAIQTQTIHNPLWHMPSITLHVPSISPHVSIIWRIRAQRMSYSMRDISALPPSVHARSLRLPTLVHLACMNTVICFIRLFVSYQQMTDLPYMHELYNITMTLINTYCSYLVNISMHHSFAEQCTHHHIHPLSWTLQLTHHLII